MVGAAAAVSVVVGAAAAVAVRVGAAAAVAVRVAAAAAVALLLVATATAGAGAGRAALLTVEDVLRVAVKARGERFIDPAERVRRVPLYVRIN